MANTQERIARVLLRVGVDRKELTNARQQLDTFNKTLADLERQKALSKLAQDSARMVSEGRSLRATLGQMRGEIIKLGATDTEIKQLVTEFDRLRSAADKANNATKGSGRGRSFLTAAGQELRALPAVGIPGAGGLSTDVIGKLTASLGGLPPVAAAGAVASAALVAALVALAAQFEKDKQAALQAIEFQARLNLLREQGTKKDIQAQIDAAQQRFDTARSQVQVAEQTIENFLNSFENAAHREINEEAIRKAIAGGFKAIVPPEVQAAIDTIIGQGAEAERALIELTGLKNTIKDTAVVSREATEAEKVRAAELQTITDQRIKVTLQAELAASKLSASAIQQRITDINREQAAILAIARAGEIGNEALAEMTQRQRDLAAELQVLVDALPAAQAREKIQSFVDGLLNIPKTVGQVTNAIEALQKASADIANLKAEFFARTKEITDREQDALNKAIADRDRAISEAEQRAADQRADLRFDEQTAEIRHLQAIARIRRNANRDIDRAIADRDAIALSEARQNKQDQLTDQKQQYDNEQRELKRRNEVINRELRQATAQIQARYIEQTNEAKAAAIRALTIEQQKFAKELEIKTAAYQKLLTADQQAAANVINVHANYWQNALVLAQRAVTVISSASNQAAQVKRFGNPGASSGGKIPSLDTGGKILQSGYAFLHRNEVVINPARQNQQGMAGLTINITAANRRELHRQIDRKLDDFIVTNF